MIIKTDGGPVLGVTNDTILATINATTAHHNVQFLAAYFSPTGNIDLETPPNTSADQGAMHGLEITATLDSLNIMVDHVFANSCWTCFVLYRVLTTLETWNRWGNFKETRAAIAAEIEQATGFTLTQHPQWLIPMNKLNDQDRGSVKVSFPGKSFTLGTTSVFLFNRRGSFKAALPSISAISQCFRCQRFGHRQERCKGLLKCAVCATAHTTDFHT